MLTTSDNTTSLPNLVSSASGTILEIGAGSGSQLPRYDKTKIQHIYGVEPNLDLHDALRAKVKECGLSDVYTLVPCAVEDVEELCRYGIEGASIDTVLSVKVLCSVPRPEEMTRVLWGMLRPGGDLLVYEHVRSLDVVSRFVQGGFCLWTEGVFIFGSFGDVS